MPWLRYILRVPNKMPISDYAKLFQRSGTESNLRFLWSRLAEHDLTRSEALAMVSAVHRDLSQSEADDPRLYVSYARFMGSLERDMPAVHEHVVTTWVQSRHPERPALSSPQPASPALLRPEPAMPDDAPLIEGDTLESAPPARALADTGLRQFIRAVQMDVGAAEGPEEPGEPGEQHSESAGSAREPRSAVAAETQDEDDPQEDEEPDPRSTEKLEGAAEEEEPVEPDDGERSRDEQAARA